MSSFPIRLLLFCLPLLLTSGCLTAPNHKVPPERLAGVNRVGVLTLTSPSMHGRLVATTAFGNASWEGSEPGLAVADWVFGAVKASLTHPTLRLDEKRLAGIRPSFRPRFVGSGPDPIAAEAVRRLGKENDIQILLVLSSAISGDFLTQTNQAMEAQGLFSRRFSGRGQDFSYFVANIEVYDTRDGKRIDEIWCANGALISPSEVVWHDAWALYPPAAKQAVLSSLAQTTEAAVKRSVAATGL